MRGNRGGFPGGTQGGVPGGQGGFPGNQGGIPGGNQGQQGGTTPGQQGGMTGGGMRGGGGMGGLLNAATVSDQMKQLLEADADKYTWIAAAVGSQSASGYQLATQKPVMPVGGFNGTDPSPTLAQFQKYVADGKIHYFIGGGGFGGGGRGGTSSGSSDSSQISTWVQENFQSQTVDNVTIYDLTQPTQ